MIEVGAGEGRLTTALASASGRVVAYEIDPVVATALRRRCAGLDNVRCVRGDFLLSRPPEEPFAVVGNIPYASTAPVVRWCLGADSMTAATLVTQLEYARKRTGDFGRWSRLTVASWPRFDWRLGHRIDRRLFQPVPRVDSAVIRLSRRSHPLLPADLMPVYRAFVELGFGGYGGSLRSSLRRQHPRRAVDAALRAAAVPADTVVAFVHPTQWLTIFRTIHSVET